MKEPERKGLSWRERLPFAIVGLFTIAYGYGQVLRGNIIYTNWRGLDVPAYFVIVVGILLIILSVFPWGRIQFLWNTGRKKRF